MYTRSYGTPKPAVIRSPLPPDYSGTALSEPIVFNDTVQPDSQSSITGTQNNPNLHDSNASHDIIIGHSKQAKKEQRSTPSKRPSDRDIELPRNTESVGRAPFGNIGKIENEYSDETYYQNVSDDTIQNESRSSDQKSDRSSLGDIIFPDGVRNDDLLLLGLIFLLYNESKTDEANQSGCREVIMLLALLYIAGM